MTPKYDIRLSPQLTAFGNVAARPLIHPTEQDFWPDPDNLRWHTHNRFRAR